nr:MAG TPA: hypothetical protein [Caudoviricetes sp.]
MSFLSAYKVFFLCYLLSPSGNALAIIIFYNSKYARYG